MKQELIECSECNRPMSIKERDPEKGINYWEAYCEYCGIGIKDDNELSVIYYICSKIKKYNIFIGGNK